MKDICGNEIQAGDSVHIWWDTPSMDGSEATHHDYLCTVVRTRGRGIKFVTDDEKTLTSDYLVENNAKISIQGSRQRAKKEEQVGFSDSVTPEELEMIGKLRGLGWYGSLFKKTLLLSTLKIEMPEVTKEK